MELEQRQGAAADLRGRLDELGARDRGGERRGALAQPVAAQHPQDRDLAAVAVRAQRRLERGERELVDPQRTRERVAAGAVDRAGPAGEEPRLRAAQQLVAGEAGERGAGRDRAAHGRFVVQLGQGAGADVVDHGHAELAQRLDRHVLDEAELAEVRRVHAQDRAGAGAERVLVVAQPRAVGGPDLDEPRTRLRDHVRDAEAAADLDQLPARDDHVLAGARQRGGGQQRRARAVVDRERRLGAGQLAQQRLHVGVARAAGAGLEVQLEVRVAGRGARDGLARLGPERGAAEVRVHDHAGRVEDALERRRGRGPRPLTRPFAQVGVLAGAALELLPPLREHRTRRRQRERPRRAGDLRRERVDRREVAQRGHQRTRIRTARE